MTKNNEDSGNCTAKTSDDAMLLGRNDGAGLGDRCGEKILIKGLDGMEIDDRDYDVRQANKKASMLFLMGFVLLVIAFALEGKIPEFIEEFIYIAGWVALWEMVECFILDNPKKRTERLNKLQLYDSEVTFVFDK